MITYFDSEFVNDGLVTEQCVSCGLIKRIKPLPSKEHSFVCDPCWQAAPEVVEVGPDPDDPTRILVYTRKKLTVNKIELKITCKVEDQQTDETERDGNDDAEGGAGSDSPADA